MPYKQTFLFYFILLLLWCGWMKRLTDQDFRARSRSSLYVWRVIHIGPSWSTFCHAKTTTMTSHHYTGTALTKVARAAMEQLPNAGTARILYSITMQLPTKQGTQFSGERWQLNGRAAERDRKVSGSNPGRSGGRILFSMVNFLCWLLFRYLLPQSYATTVARKRFRSFCQRCRWQVTAKHECTPRMWLRIKRHCKLVHGCVRNMRRDSSSFTWHQSQNN